MQSNFCRRWYCKRQTEWVHFHLFAVSHSVRRGLRGAPPIFPSIQSHSGNCGIRGPTAGLHLALPIPRRNCISLGSESSPPETQSLPALQSPCSPLPRSHSHRTLGASWLPFPVYPSSNQTTSGQCVLQGYFWAVPLTISARNCPTKNFYSTLTCGPAFNLPSLFQHHLRCVAFPPHGHRALWLPPRDSAWSSGPHPNVPLGLTTDP